MTTLHAPCSPVSREICWTDFEGSQPPAGSRRISQMVSKGKYRVLCYTSMWLCPSQPQILTDVFRDLLWPLRMIVGNQVHQLRDCKQRWPQQRGTARPPGDTPSSIRQLSQRQTIIVFVVRWGSSELTNQWREIVVRWVVAFITARKVTFSFWISPSNDRKCQRLRI